MGFQRHLDAGEIYAQVAYARAFLRLVGMPGAPDHLTNLVFMGMGEPLANYPRVREAIDESSRWGACRLDRSRFPLSGSFPGSGDWPRNLGRSTLAVSLHAADDELRSRLVPINQRYPLAEVEEATAYYFERKRRRISIEWTMIDGVNDSDEQAEKLVPIARRLKAHVNLIPLNATPMSADRPADPDRIRSFVRILRRPGHHRHFARHQGQGHRCCLRTARRCRGCHLPRLPLAKYTRRPVNRTP